MAHFEYDEFGMRYYIDDAGNETPAPEAGALETAMIAAGKQTSDIGRGIRSALGEDVSAEAAEAAMRYAPLEAESPYLTMAGEMLPSMVAAPISAAGMGVNMALQAGIGALEGYLDYDNRASGGQRALAGAAGGLGGDIAGRILGRAVNLAKGAIRDFGGVRPPAQNPAAQRFEELGGQTMAYQRLEPNSDPAKLAERAAQGMEVALNAPPVMQKVMDANDALFRKKAASAVGLNGDDYAYFGQEFISDARDRFNREFARIGDVAERAGALELSEKLAGRLLRNRSIKAAIDEDDLFASLSKNTLEPGEYIEARAALSDNISRLYKQGETNRAIRAEKLLDELDSAIGSKLPKGFRDEFARVREQYRVFSIMEKPNVINGDGNINVRTLRNALDSKTSGFGRTATSGGQTTNRESRELIDLMQAADTPVFKAPRSSGTAENQALRTTLDAAGEAAAGALAGDPRPALGFMGKLMAPRIIGASQTGAGNMFTEAFTPSPMIFPQAGGVVGRGFLDEQLYPFVGAEDDRQP
jgi:hypothetical protein